MSTVTPRPQQQKPHRKWFRNPQGTPDVATERTLRSRRGLWVGIGVFAALFIVWLAPSIVAHSPLLRTSMIRSMVGEVDGAVTVRTASLGWFSPIRVYDVDVRDKHGATILHAPTLEGDRSLLALLTSKAQLGRFRLDKPKIAIIAHDGTTNVEQLLTQWMKANPSSSQADVSLEIVQGEVTLHSEMSGHDYKLDQVDAALKIPALAAKPVEVAIAARVPDAAGPGTAQLDLSYNRGDKPSGEFDCKINALPLDMLSAIGERLGDIDISGRATCNLKGKWSSSDKNLHVDVSGKTSTKQFALGMPSLGQDKFAFDDMQCPLQVTLDGDRLQIKQFEIRSDLGTIAITGVLDTSALRNAQTTSELLTVIRHAQGQLNADVDLARVAQVLPSTLGIRAGTQITSGRVKLSLVSQPAAKGNTWHGQIDATRLVGQAGGREIAWDMPLQVKLDASETDKGLVVDKLNCTSDFLELEGSGNLDYMELAASYDLKRLAAELGRFVNLDGVRLQGDGSAYAAWKRDANRHFTSDTNIELNNFEWSRAGTMPWTEKQLLITASAVGSMDGTRLRKLETATCSITSGTDRCTAQLTEPVTDFAADARWPFSGRLQGEAGRWVARLQPWIGTIEGWEVGGTVDATAAGNWTRDRWEVAQAHGTIDKLHLVGHGLYVSEPRAELVGAGSWRAETQELVLRDTKLTTSALGANVSQLSLSTVGASGVKYSGKVNFDGDVTSLQRWVQDPAQPPTWQAAGRIQGSATVSQAGGGAINFDSSGAITNLVVTPRTGKAWREKQLDFGAKGAYDRKTDVLQLASSRIEGDALAATAQGSLTQFSGARTIDLDGKIDYDLARVVELFRPIVGNGIQLAGRESRTFHIAGPLAPPPVRRGQQPSVLAGLTGNGELGWQAMSLYGVTTGPGVLQAKLDRGLLTTAPLDLPLSEGRVHIATSIRLSPAPTSLTLSPGPLLDHVRATPQMCSQFLSYAAPVLAGVTQVQGQVSADVEGCDMPLANSQAMEASGTLTIHSMEISAGPLVQELTVLLARPAAARITRESKVPVRITQGRVYHRDLELVFPDLTIRTYGSVGWDQSLALMAEMPVPPKWLGNNTLGAALKDQTIKLPIGGTLSQPKIDQRTLNQVASQFVRDAATGAVRGEVNRQLDRLFNRPQ